MCVSCFVLVFVFFKQKTAYEMRISDWSSDVCSSDLPAGYDAVSSPISAPGAEPGRGSLTASAQARDGWALSSPRRWPGCPPCLRSWKKARFRTACWTAGSEARQGSGEHRYDRDRKSVV